MIETNQLSKIEDKMTQSDKEAFENAVHKYKWAVILGSIIFTFVALISFFGYASSHIYTVPTSADSPDTASSAQSCATAAW